MKHVTGKYCMEPPEPESGSNIVKIEDPLPAEEGDKRYYQCISDYKLETNYSMTRYEITCANMNDGTYEGVDNIPTCIESKCPDREGKHHYI